MPKRIGFSIMIFLLSFGGHFCFSQDWRAIRNNGTYMFSDNHNEFHAYHVFSSWASGSDSVYMSFPVIQEMDWDCFSPTEGSWIGRMTVIKPNGDNVFLNYNYDSVLVRTTASLGDSWQMCDSGNVTATVIAIVDTSFLGLNDSVKVINLNSSINYLNNSKMILSKHYGLIRMWDFFHFTESLEPWLYEQPRIYELKGMSNPLVGVQNLTRVETVTYSVGDEFHRYSNFQSSMLSSIHTSSESWAIYKVVEIITTAMPDTIKYLFERCMKKRETYYDGDSSGVQITFFNDTISVRYILNTMEVFDFDRLPGEPILSNNGIFEYGMTLHQSGRRGKNYPSIIDIFDGPDWYNCWHQPIIDACMAPKYYYDGIFGVNFYCHPDMLIDERIVYYKKGTETWGTPYDCGTILSDDFGQDEDKKAVTISPNPATDHFMVELPYAFPGLDFKLYNITGTLVKQLQLNTPSTNVDCVDLPAGLYLFSITGTAGDHARGKLMIQ